MTLTRQPESKLDQKNSGTILGFFDERELTQVDSGSVRVQPLAKIPVHGLPVMQASVWDVTPTLRKGAALSELFLL